MGVPLGVRSLLSTIFTIETYGDDWGTPIQGNWSKHVSDILFKHVSTHKFLGRGQQEDVREYVSLGGGRFFWVADDRFTMHLLLDLGAPGNIENSPGDTFATKAPFACNHYNYLNHVYYDITSMTF